MTLNGGTNRFDGVTGATLTSGRIKDAVKACLEKSKK